MVLLAPLLTAHHLLLSHLNKLLWHRSSLQGFLLGSVQHTHTHTLTHKKKSQFHSLQLTNFFTRDTKHSYQAICLKCSCRCVFSCIDAYFCDVPQQHLLQFLQQFISQICKFPSLDSHVHGLSSLRLYSRSFLHSTSETKIAKGFLVGPLFIHNYRHKLCIS